VPSSGQNKVVPSPTQFSILYKGKMCIYEGIPAEKVTPSLLKDDVIDEYCKVSAYDGMYTCYDFETTHIFYLLTGA